MKRFTTGIVISVLILSALMQYFFGNFPFSFFFWPLNGILALVWMTALIILCRDGRKTSLFRFLNARSTTTLTLVLFLTGCLVIGFHPQLSEEESTQGSWPFVTVLFLLLSHLGVITWTGFQRRTRFRWRFLLNHLGLWLALFAGFFGSSDLQILRIPVYREQPNRMAYATDRTVHYLDYDLQLLDFHADYYENGMPRHYEAKVKVDDQTVALQVNHPYAYGWGEDLYLTGYDRSPQGGTGSQPDFCILQIVRQPWKYVELLGIILMLFGGIGLFIAGPNRKNNDKLG